jgi:orotate phosphoribosyltransferase
MRRSPAPKESGNLWLARILWQMGAVQFGDFTLGRTTVNSPVYVNPRLLVSVPNALRRAARVMAMEARYELARRRPGVSEFQLVAGVPLGGLHLATAFSLITKVPMVYPYSSREGQGNNHVIEGRYQEGQTVLIIDDLITTGGSVLEMADLLRAHGLIVRDAMVLIDREEGATERLKSHGYNMLSVLSLEVMLNYYLSTGRIGEALYRQCTTYLESRRER